MKAHSNIFALLNLTVALALTVFATPASAASSGCNPNGHVFNLAPLVNPALNGQSLASVAFLRGRGGNGDDLVVGAGEDYRQLDVLNGDFTGLFNPAYYVQRDNNNCAADFEGGLPVGSPTLVDFLPFNPQVAADPAHDALYMAAIAQNGDAYAVYIVGSTAANLLNGTSCPNGTSLGVHAVTCWNIEQLTNVQSASNGPDPMNAMITVDQRTQGTGAGDLYITFDQLTNPGHPPFVYQTYLLACTNATLNCSPPVLISGTDDGTNLSAPVQVRADGGITVSYADITFGSVFGETAYKMRFVNCTPQGAPKPPICTAPILVTNETRAVYATIPRHVDRLESDGKTVTTFYIYDQCAVPLYAKHGVTGGAICPKTQVVVTSSADGGNTWSPIVPVSPNAPGAQFEGVIALDQSTETVNIAYNSSQNDPSGLTQIFLAQIPPGQTTIGTISPVTNILYNGPWGGTIGMAAAGTGQKGQSRVYIHFLGGAKGSVNGQGFPIYTNMLTQFDY
jgi:hypothetical protein